MRRDDDLPRGNHCPRCACPGHDSWIARIPDPETTIPALVDALRECLEQHKGVYRYGLAPRSALSTIYEKARAVLAKLEGGPQV